MSGSIISEPMVPKKSFEVPEEGGGLCPAEISQQRMAIGKSDECGYNKIAVRSFSAPWSIREEGDIPMNPYGQSYSSFFLSCFVATFFILVFTPPAQTQQNNSGYSWDVNYQQAVPAFLNAVTNSVANVSNKAEIANWADGIKARISEFLNDWIDASRFVSQQSWGNYNIDPIVQVDEKWQQILSTCPQCSALAPLVEPIIAEATRGLPQVREPLPTDTPFQNYYEYFKAMEPLNPWGLAAFFQIEPLATGNQTLAVREWSREQTTSGIRQIFIDRRETMQRLNGIPIFYELIINDQVSHIMIPAHFSTMMHETLFELQSVGQDQQAIRQINWLVQTIDREVGRAWQAGLLDNFTLAYLYDQAPIYNEMIHVTHPLLRDPFNQIYKVAPFYPRTYYGWPPSPVGTIPAGTLEVVSMAASPVMSTEIPFSPAPNVPATEPALLPEALSPPPLPPAVPVGAIQDTLSSYSMSAEKVGTLWTMLIIAPMFLWSILGAVRV